MTFTIDGFQLSACLFTIGFFVTVWGLAALVRQAWVVEIRPRRHDEMD